MTSLQASDISALGPAGEEDPMELSMDFEKRLLDEEDIDIDLGLDGKSPFNQEDDYMLEGTNFMEDYDGQPDGNDDEMVDEVGTPQPMADAPEIYAQSGFDDATGFDILVDDEDLVDADDTMSQSGSVANHVEQDLDSHNVSSSQLPENFEQNFLESGDRPLIQPRGDDDVGFQPIHEALFTTSNLNADEEDPSHNAQDNKSPTSTYSSSNRNAEANNAELLEGHIEFLSGPDHGDEKSSAVEAPIEEDSGDNIKDNEKRFYTPSEHESATSDPDRTPTPTAPFTIASELRGLNDSDDIETLSHDVLEEGNSVHQSLDTDSANDPLISVSSDHVEQEQHAGPAHDAENQDLINLHPVIVVYQDNEISLFPPHEETEKHSATYFLQDESIAKESIRALLGACRVVLADSIGEHDELEVKIVPLGIDISETCSEASTFSLLQIMNLYLQLQHNDGMHYPDPLHVILTTKLSLPYRLQYLYNAVEEGLGFLDIVLPSSVEVIESRTEIDDEQSQDKVPRTKEEPEKWIGQRSTVAEADDGSDKIASSLDRLLHDPNNAQNIEIKTRNEDPTMTQANSDDYNQDQHPNAGVHYLGEVPTSTSIDSIAVESGSDHVLGSAQPNKSDSVHTVEAQIFGAFFNEKSHDGDADYEGQEKEPQVPSAASSTLRGDASDVAHGEAQADSLTITSQDEYQSREASYEGVDDRSFSTTVPNISEGSTDLLSGVMNHTAGLSRPANSPSTPVSQRKNSASVSAIDNNEITYEDEEDDEEENQDEGTGDEEENQNEGLGEDDDDDDDDFDDFGEADENEDILSTESHSIEDNHSLPPIPLSQHDSLKRARGEEDANLSPEVDLQGMGPRARSVAVTRLTCNKLT
ncbi:hypothetical protein MMC26_004153 [Xylographa opegraphella]|nr:hypothetical protein [Xylographa opegraphella]